MADMPSDAEMKAWREKWEADAKAARELRELRAEAAKEERNRQNREEKARNADYRRLQREKKNK